MNETIGNRIQKHRKEKGLTQEELASQLDVSSQAVSKWETDVSCPDISLLPRLSGVLGITTDVLLTGRNATVQYIPVEQQKSLDELTLRVKVLSAQGDKIRVNLPMRLVKVCMELGVDIAPNYVGKDLPVLHNIDLSKVMDMVEKGLIGKLVEIESADGDVVEVVVE